MGQESRRRGRSFGGWVSRAPTLRSLFSWGAALLLAGAVWPGHGMAAPAIKRAPAEKIEHSPEELDDPNGLLRADTITYEPNTDIMHAEGNVEINYQGQILYADRVTYDQKKDIVTADGNVILIDQDSTVTFTEHAVLTEKMHNGVISKMGMLMADNSRMAANSAIRRLDNYTVLNKVVYSPCDLCKDTPHRAPLWRVRARRAIHDHERKEITYHHAYFDMFGFPIGYMPYASQPDPTVKRKTGFLLPSIGSKSDIGSFITIPYYFALSDSYDLTLSPTITSQQGVVARAEFRQRTQRGAYILDGSITRPTTRSDDNERGEGRDFRGHIFGSGQFELNQLWSWGFDIQRTTDDTYMRRYGISSLDRLENRLYTQRVQDRNYFVANAYAFQDLRAGDVPGQTPLVAPEILYYKVMEPAGIGGRLAITGNLLSLTRPEGIDIHRVIGKVDWRRQFITPSGQLITPFLGVRTDVYYTNDVPIPGMPAGTLAGVDDAGGTTFRALPQIGVEWRWPFARAGRKLTQVIEPIAQFIYAPRGGNPSTIPNDDSVAFEFDDTNLFSEDRFPGYDRVEDGARVNYGLRAAVYWPKGAFIEALVGQSYRFLDVSPFPAGSGVDTSSSDIVGRFTVSPSKHFGLYQRFRLDKETLKLSKSETELYVRYGRVLGAVEYARLSENDSVVASSTREAVGLTLNLDITKYWSLKTRMMEDLTNNQTVYREATLLYTDECAQIGLTFRRDYTSDRDIRPSNSVLFIFQLANMG